MISYPLGLCSTCCRHLADCEKLGSTEVPGCKDLKAKRDLFKLQDIQIPRGQEAATCICDICVARRTQFRKVKVVPGGKTQNDEKPVKMVPYLKCW